MDQYDFKEAFDEGHRLVNRVLNAEMQKGDYLHIRAEFNMYVNSMITTQYDDIVEVGPCNSCLCVSLSAENWEIEDLPEVSE